ncbi:MAG: TIGR02186 family protein [Rhodothalassiaceae bacterium]
MIAWLAGVIIVLGLAAPPLLVDLSVSRVEIRYSFAGANLLLFGAIGEAADQADRLDVLVVVKGPPTPTVVRRKDRIAGIWVNRESVEFDDAPGFYYLASTRPLDAFISADQLAALAVRPEDLPLQAEADDEAAKFRAALIRLKRQEGLYGLDPDAVTIRQQRLFRTDIPLPANVPTGPYAIDIYLFADGRLAARDRASLEVTKEGFERLVYTLANDRPFLYGLFAVVIALIAGWLAALVGQRRR